MNEDYVYKCQLCMNMCDECAMEMDLFKKQVRTIRRLRALADGYRALVRYFDGERGSRERSAKLGWELGAGEERARIVAAVRKMADRAERDDSWNGEQCHDIADAIERGEL